MPGARQCRPERVDQGRISAACAVNQVGQEQHGIGEEHHEQDDTDDGQIEGPAILDEKKCRGALETYSYYMFSLKRD